jgi:hypothetical protein
VIVFAWGACPEFVRFTKRTRTPRVAFYKTKPICHRPALKNFEKPNPFGEDPRSLWVLQNEASAHAKAQRSQKTSVTDKRICKTNPIRWDTSLASTRPSPSGARVRQSGLTKRTQRSMAVILSTRDLSVTRTGGNAYSTRGRFEAAEMPRPIRSTEKSAGQAGLAVRS